MSTTHQRSLNRHSLLFPLALVLFEFSVYIGNDLVQPAMLAITKEFGVPSSWAPSAMSFYLLGGAVVAGLLGPLSDRLGRKKIMLAGVAFFVCSCVTILFSTNMGQFLGLRLLQGTGLTVVTVVGYAAIQETFAERDAIKVMALMANISLLSPLLGPILGSFLINHLSWHWGFIGIAALSAVSWFGLRSNMPTGQPMGTQQPWRAVLADFKQVYRNRQFLGFTLSIPLLSLPLMLWIALSPVILVDELGLSSMQYGLAQFPVLGGLIVGNILLVHIVDKLALGRSVQIALPIMLVGAVMVMASMLWPTSLLSSLIIGMTLIALGEGISFSVLYRFALMSSNVSKGTVAAALSILLALTFFVSIEGVRIAYQHGGIWAYAWACLLPIALWFGFPRRLLTRVMAKRQAQNIF